MYTVTDTAVPVRPPVPRSMIHYSLISRPFRGGKGPGVYCLRMRQNIRYITRKIIVYNTQTGVYVQRLSYTETVSSSHVYIRLYGAESGQYWHGEPTLVYC